MPRARSRPSVYCILRSFRPLFEPCALARHKQRSIVLKLLIICRVKSASDFKEQMTHRKLQSTSSFLPRPFCCHAQHPSPRKTEKIFANANRPHVLTYKRRLLITSDGQFFARLKNKKCDVRLPVRGRGGGFCPMFWWSLAFCHCEKNVLERSFDFWSALECANGNTHVYNKLYFHVFNNSWMYKLYILTE